VIHINAISKNTADDKIRQALRRFAVEHPAPATVILISGLFSFSSSSALWCWPAVAKGCYSQTQGWQVFARRWKNRFSMVKTGLAKILLFAGKNRFLPAKIGLCRNCHQSKLEP